MFEHYNPTSYIQTTTTGDNRIHAAWWFRGVLDYEGYSNYGIDETSVVPGLIHDYYDDEGNLSEENIDNGFDEYSFTDISSTTNDLFVIWKSPSSSYLKFRQYDTYPANPSSLTMSSYNGHPKLTWSKNPDADLDYYRIYKKKGSGSYTLYATVSGSANTEYVDNEEMVVTGPRIANEVDVYYVVTAKDLGGLESSYSNSVTTRISVDPPEKQGNDFDKPITFSLNQNYPNPFNPNTTIEYSIPERQYVSLKIYNSIGKEVFTLVNEVKEAGNYKVNFNSDANFPSGIYFYKINAGSFNKVKKMILMK
ncbi:MAG TPA: T9SS type A sorting domain-containing protein [Ignavibacteriaceae bacterium]|nr:T9SS type A sorting domain-containing protein [Ignavibacteriaceae bacterium]